MLNLWNEILKPFVMRFLLSPFSNKVTKVFLYSGAAIVAAPLIEHLILKVVLSKFFGIDLPIDVPDTQAYIFGSFLMTVGAIHNISYLYIEKESKIEEAKRIDKARDSQYPHDLKIITEILSLLPYENTHYWLEKASYAGLRRDFVHDLDLLEKRYSAPLYNIYNEKVQNSKNKLIEKIAEFNLSCMGHLGGQEDKTGEMYLPPYHWKGKGETMVEKYYAQVESVAKSAQALKNQLDEFISTVKSEGFILEI